MKLGMKKGSRLGPIVQSYFRYGICNRCWEAVDIRSNDNKTSVDLSECPLCGGTVFGSWYSKGGNTEGNGTVHIILEQEI